MLFTTQGMQLCKITVVGIDGKLVYETLVQPEDPIVDYNTRFSGVSAKDLKRGPTKSLKEVQNDLLGFISANSILMGHSLENDLRALKVSDGLTRKKSYFSGPENLKKCRAKKTREKIK